jgi:predicted GNAT family N-acyltransferase
MPRPAAIICREVEHGTYDYRETVALRERVLREPLGLRYSASELSAEVNSIHLAAMQAKDVVATAILEPRTHLLVKLRQMAVADGMRGIGVGRELVEFAEAVAYDYGYRQIALHARETAQGFYEKLGYLADGERFEEVGLPHFRMYKVLDD